MRSENADGVTPRVGNAAGFNEWANGRVVSSNHTIFQTFHNWHDDFLVQLILAVMKYCPDLRSAEPRNAVSREAAPERKRIFAFAARRVI
jgi:hypothetical protein